MADKELDIIIKVKDSASKGLKTVDKNVNRLGKSAQTATKSMKSMYAGLVAIAGVLAGGALLGSSVKAFASFDDNMRAAGAVTKATTKDLELMTEAAKDMGRETRYTSANAAEALRFLGMAGLSATQATAALPDVLNLAAAGALDLGTAADITTNVLSAFGLEVEQLSRVNDVMVQTFTNSNVNLAEVGEAFKIVGPIAKGVGADFEDLVGTIGALGNAGIKGTLAGTALKGAIGALLNPTKQEAQLIKDLEGRMGGLSLKIRDANGDFIGFKTIIEQLEKAGLKGEEALKLFGERAGPGMAALMNMGSESMAELIKKLRESGGVAKDIADQMEAGLGGQIRKTISMWQAFQLALGDAMGPTVIRLMEGFRIELNKMIQLVQSLAEDGTFDEWGGRVVWVLKHIGAAADGAMLRMGAFFNVMTAGWKLLKGDLDGADKAMNSFVRDINKIFAKEKDPLAEEAGKVIKAITQEMYDELAASAKDDGPIGKGAEKVGNKIVDKIKAIVSDEALSKSAMIKLAADLQLQAEIIEQEYDQGLLSLDEYYKERAALVTRQIAAELSQLKSLVAAETDVSKSAILDAKIGAKESQLTLELLKIKSEKSTAEDKLLTDRLKKESEINKLRLKAEKVFEDQKERVKEGDGVTTLDSQFAKEIAELQTKQNTELEIVRDYHNKLYQEKVAANASDVELEKAKEEQMAAIRDQSAFASQEKSQQIADQNLRLQEYKLNNLKNIAQGTADIFQNLYEMTGKENQALFYAAKGAAIAEATINVAQGVTKALAQGGVYGIATGAIVAAAGAIQIATIASTGFAEGGEVPGYSPQVSLKQIAKIAMLRVV